MLIGPKVAPRLAHMSILKPCRALMTDLGGFTGWYLKPELEGTGYEVSCPMDNLDDGALAAPALIGAAGAQCDYLRQLRSGVHR